MTKEYILGELKDRIEDIAILRAKSARAETLSENAINHGFKEYLLEASNSYYRRYKEELVRLDGFVDSYLDALIETAKGSKCK